MEYLFIILNLILIESLLSVDNAAVLAALVKGLPEKEQQKALRYGIIGAYVFRGLCLLFASILVKITWLKIAGGLYLLWLVYKHFSQGEEPQVQKVLGLSGLWSTILMVEFIDLSFSIDNIFAAVAFTDNIWLILIGVFIGILAMRFIAQKFVELLKKYPELETITYVVIGLLGIKLALSGVLGYLPTTTLTHILEHEYTDMCFSFAMLLLFSVPFIKRYVTSFNR
jgi:YkoY family integral membrane protein